MNHSVRKILVVDDDPLAVELERRALARPGWSVIAAGTIAEATATLRNECPAAIVLDYRLPEGPCWPVLDLSNSQTPPVPVIVVTALGDERVAAEAIHRGAVDYIIKSGEFHSSLATFVERAVRISEADQVTAHLAAIVESSNDAIMSVSLDGAILTWNTGATQIYGYSAEEASGLHVQGLFPSAARDATTGLLEDIPAGRVRHLEAKQIRKNGDVFDAALTLSPFLTEVHRAAAASVIVRDITAQKSAEREIRALLEEKTTAERKIKQLNSELEQRVAERTAELAMSNRELESFAYSVSHDLRAPLRALDGFCHALHEGYADKLDLQGRHYLQRVQEAKERMDKLIEGMLTLSRTGRSQMRRTTVDISALAQSIALELQSADPARKVDFLIAPGLTAIADRDLLRAALENLLGNSWKFTGKHPKARIEVGAVQHEGQIAYFIRDDGAGFDMAYAGKLFGAFQRLHRQEEFEGLGVGLANVQRIIHKHGGKIWAEAQTEKGATFFFTLPAKAESDESAVEQTSVGARTGPCDGR